MSAAGQTENGTENLKKVLILAYYFPPLGMGGTQRMAKFIKYLPEFGWKPVVVTVKEIAYYARDTSLLEDVSSASIYRAGSLDPQRLLAIFASKRSNSDDAVWTDSSWQKINKLISFLFIPDPKILWLPFALVKCARLIQKEKIDVILTSSPPHSLQLVGLLLKKIKRVRWVVDFRDGWSGGNFQREPTRIHRRLNRFLEQRIVQASDRVVAVSSQLLQSLQRFAPENPDKFHTITNGYDADDLPQAITQPSPREFSIVYCGTISPISPIESFMTGLTQALHKRPDMAEDMRVSFIGIDLTGTVHILARKHGLSGIIEHKGYLSHKKALAEIVKADLLLYPIADSASEDFIPGKTFEYLASGNRVLAIGPQVAGVKILEECGAVETLAHADIAAIEQALITHYDKTKMNGRLRRQQRSFLHFERKHLTARLAEVLEQASSPEWHVTR